MIKPFVGRDAHEISALRRPSYTQGADCVRESGVGLRGLSRDARTAFKAPGTTVNAKLM